MTIIAKLYVDDKVFNVLRYRITFNQGSDVTGRPSQRTVFKGLVLTLETQKDTNFYEWMLAKNLTKNIELHLEPSVIGGRIRKIRLFDAHLVNLNTNFSSTGGEPLSETLTISAAGFDDSFSAGEYTASWRVSFPQEETTATSIEEEYEPTLLDYFFEDESGFEIAQKDLEPNQKVTLVLQTENADGETIDLTLNNSALDYIYDGEVAENDTIKNIVITGEETRVKLKTIKEA